MGLAKRLTILMVPLALCVAPLGSIEARAAGHGGGGHGGGGHMGGGHMGGMGGGHMGGGMHMGGGHMGGMGGGMHMGGAAPRMGGGGMHMGGAAPRMGGGAMHYGGGMSGANRGFAGGAGAGRGNIGGAGGINHGFAGNPGVGRGNLGGAGGRGGMSGAGNHIAGRGGMGGVGGAGNHFGGRGNLGGAGGAGNHIAGRGGMGGVGGAGNHVGGRGNLGGMNHGLGNANRPGLNSGARPNYGQYAMGNHGGVNHGGVNRGGAGAGGLNRGLANNGFNGNRTNLNHNGLNRGNSNFNNSFNRVNNITSINNTRNISQTSFNGRGGWGGGGGWNHGGWNRGGWGGGWNRGGWGYGRGYGGWGGGYGGWGYGGWGLGGFGYGFGSGLGFGLGYGLLGLGWGGLGWGGLGYGGLGYGGFGYGGWGGGYGGWGYGGYGGYGISPWLYGSSLYNWGYSSYYNPYVSTVVVDQPVVYDYSQPIDTQAAVSQVPADTAVSNFDQAREAFSAGNYNKALDLADLAIRETPNDAALHEFRALSLFALGRYNEAATTLYSVLAVGPGWDWATLASLYPNISDYTAQLRRLEGYIAQNPQAAPARFVLAYHYLTENHPDAAVQQLRQVVALQPKDSLSAQLLQQLQPNNANTPAASAPGIPPAPGLQATGAFRPTDPVVTGREGRLEGTWTANPDSDTSIALSFAGGDRFVWTVTHQGKSQKMEGSMTFGKNILTLAQSQGPALVGNLAWLDETHFNFKVPGANPNDPGLSFAKNP